MTRQDKKEELIRLFCIGAISIGDLIDEGFEFGQQQQNWISVEDELPEETDLYIVVQNNIVQAYWWFNGIKEWRENTRRMEGVTHWMPLPQPPVVSDSENTGRNLKGGEQ